jgi:gliding motility-associated peptidyl-prolyl isomerase
MKSKFTFISALLVLTIGMVGCKNKQEARKPVSYSTGNMQKSIDNNIKLVASEEDDIKELIKLDLGSKYYQSKVGYWYKYDLQNTKDTLRPKRGDVTFFDYEIQLLNGDVVYTQQELKSQRYFVDKQEIIMGLRDGIKLMRKGEKVKFIFPSRLGYGYHGDDKKIETNTPLIVNVHLKEILSEKSYNKSVMDRRKKKDSLAVLESSKSKDSI